jgi:hypothetical protein
MSEQEQPANTTPDESKPVEGATPEPTAAAAEPEAAPDPAPVEAVEGAQNVLTVAIGGPEILEPGMLVVPKGRDHGVRFTGDVPAMLNAIADIAAPNVVRVSDNHDDGKLRVHLRDG